MFESLLALPWRPWRGGGGVAVRRGRGRSAAVRLVTVHLGGLVGFPYYLR